MSGKKDVKLQIDRLREQIRYHDRLYYGKSQPEISDKEYDDLMRRLQELEQANPGLITPDSPTQRVSGEVSESFSPVAHKQKMFSLDNTYSLEELREWEKKVKRMLKKDGELSYIVELKIDGVSCSLLYENGSLIRGATRGDGSMGEDVTANIRTIVSLPLKLSSEGLPSFCEVRGEVYMNKNDLKRINAGRLERGEPPFANPRNAASGSLKLLDPRLVSRRGLKCFIHSFGWIEGGYFDSQKDFLDNVGSWGLPVNPHNQYCSSLEEVLEYCRKWEKERERLEYEVDGVVVKINDFSLQQSLGATLKSPRWAVAFKFPAHQATTRVLKIDFGVGRTGIITPVAFLKPVECGGVTIRRATLHNFDEIKRLDVREGDAVLIERAGDVIPKVVKVISSQRKKYKVRKISVPKYCPVCASKVAKEKEEEVYWYCINPDCPARIKGSLFHFGSRAAMDIQGLGESVIEEIVSRGLVTSLADLYNTISKEKLLGLPLFKEKKAEKLLQAIKESRGRGLDKFLYGLGIRHVGEKSARILALKYGNIAALMKAGQEELQSIPEIGPIVAASVFSFFSLPKVKSMIDSFKKAGLTLRVAATTSENEKFAGKVFVFTGELKNLSRVQARDKVERFGGRWASTVSRNTDFVVAGKNPGSKFEKARQLRVAIIDEKEFLRMSGS